jgi:predicted metalloprotease with PDZ domain
MATAVLSFVLLALPRWTYEVTATGSDLAVRARFPPGSGDELTIEGTEDFVSDVQVAGQAVARTGDRWNVPACRRGCSLTYRFALGAAAATDDPDVAARFGKMIEAPPASWLLHPRAGARGASIQFRVVAAPGERFAVGLPPGDEPGTYALEADALPLSPYAAFGPMETSELPVGAQSLRIAVTPSGRELDGGELLQWISQQAHAVAAYFGRLPVDHTLLLVLPVEGRGVHGRTMGGGGATVLFWLGTRATRATLQRDWVLVHELVHTALPSLQRYAHRWAEEGLATYVEPIVRVRAGQISDARFWRDLMEGLPQGLPRAGDRGLDATPTWGRTYWGGALFWLLADVQIRERTRGARSLDDALRAVILKSGGIAARWPLARVLREGDAAVGVPVLEELHARMGATVAPVDLDSLFRRLGVIRRGSEVRFDDGAPLAGVRAAITRRP